MEQEQKNTSSQAGSWNQINTTVADKSPKVVFELDNVVKATFAEDFDEPREYPSKDGSGVFYVFDCTVDGEERVIMTSAWSLLRGLKMSEPLAGKTVDVVKSLTNGKQYYHVNAA